MTDYGGGNNSSGGGGGSGGGGQSNNNPMRLYVGNLPPDATKRDLEGLFQKYGSMLDVSVKRTVSGAPFAFIEFEDERDAHEAISGRDGYNYNGNRLRVEIPFASRSGGYRRGRGRGAGAPRRGEYRVVVTGLPPSGSWQDLKDHMRDVGECVYADVFRDGTGVVEFTRRDDCDYALEKFKDSKFRSHEGEVSRISVRLAEDRTSQSPRRGSGYRDDYRESRGSYRDEPRGGYRDEPRREYRDSRDDSRGGYRDEYRGGGYRGDSGGATGGRFHDDGPRYDNYRPYEERGRRQQSYSPVNGGGSRGRSRSRSRR